ncbi:MAG: DUF504 domain-containing protein [Sulfolobales archaeon]|nr:DUF504 domain-containing protein [Sulfolobales archaeon]MCX8198565.1 DUF504 domain-containing protein [Sulfolobales archaeon]MDW8169638.1 DUF504 domain-containing protein [Desulfurococcaceae archaeon]
MGRKKGKVEEWVKTVFYRGLKEYVILIKHREKGIEVLKPIKVSEIIDIRSGYLILSDGTPIPLHRVVEVRDEAGSIIYSRL